MKKLLQNRNSVKYLAVSTMVLAMIIVHLLWTSVWWGGSFPHPLLSLNINFDCLLNDQPICCALLNEKDVDAESFNSMPRVPPTGAVVEEYCQIKKEYLPSAYETAHYEKARDLSKIKDEKTRRDALIAFMFDDIQHSNIWLERVRVRMQANNITTTYNDEKYLSKFLVTQTCSDALGKTATTSWFEWIEPITVHMRHPFSFTECFPGWSPMPYWVSEFRSRSSSMDFSVGLIDGDYILLQSGLEGPAPQQQQQQQLRARTEGSGQGSGGNNAGARASKASAVSSDKKKLMFDVGSSTFDTSLFWFVCGYLQVTFIPYDFLFFIYWFCLVA
jgi:hypothetical protein